MAEIEISDEMVEAFARGFNACPSDDTGRHPMCCTRAGLAAALVASGWRPSTPQCPATAESVLADPTLIDECDPHACVLSEGHDGEWHPCRCGAKFKLATALEPVGTHAQGYAEAVARLRDDARYRDWWTSGGVKPDAPIRRHLADYLETVGPDGPDVTTGRWPAREHAVIRAAIAWRRSGDTADGHRRAEGALIEAVDALPVAEVEGQERSEEQSHA